MVEGAAKLLAQRGLQATSFSEVLASTGAPRGSVYHHFPEGKDQLVEAALDLAGAQMRGFLDRIAGGTAEEITEHFLRLWRTILTTSGFASGCAVLAVTVAAESADLLAHAGTVFRSWRTRLAELLEQGGLAAPAAAAFATTLIAACEGAVVLCRAERSTEPLDQVAGQLGAHVRAMRHRST